MKIAFYANDITLLAGTERATFTVANQLAAVGKFDIYIIATKGDRKDIKTTLHSAITVYNLNIPNPKRSYLKLIFKLTTYLSKQKIQYFISVEMMSVLFTLPAYGILKICRNPIKYIAWEHFNYTVNLGKPIRDRCRKLAARFADAIVVLTQKDKQLWTNYLKVNGKIIAIPNPAPFPISDRSYNVGSKTIIAVGRLTFQKGFDVLIDLWNHYLKNYGTTKGWKLQIIGSGKDEILLKNKIQDYRISEYVEIIDNTADIINYYKAASFLAMTSRFEGLPMTLIEAQSLGLPIIAYDCITGPSDVITINSGILVPENNTELFTKGLLELISNETRRRKMSMAAKYEANRFQPNAIGQSWVTLLKNDLD